MKKFLLLAGIAAMACVPQAMKAGSVVYQTTIAAEKDQWDGNWQVYDNPNDPGNSWKAIYRAEGMNPGPWAKIDYTKDKETMHDDWLQSPSLKLSPETEYQLDLNYFSVDKSSGSRLSVYVSKNQDPDLVAESEPYFDEFVAEPDRYQKAGLATFTFTPEEEGNYYVSIYIYGGRGGMYVGNLLLTDLNGTPEDPGVDEPEEPKALPYSSPLVTSLKVDPDWKIWDCNDDGYTWMGHRTGLYINTMRTQDAVGATDDWAVSPKFVLEQDKTYSIRFQVRTSDVTSQRYYPENLTVYAAVGDTPEALSEGMVVVALLDFSVDKTKEYEQRDEVFTPLESGEYRIGFYCHSNVFQSGVSLKDFEISEYSSVEELLGTADAAPVYYDLQGRKVSNPERGIFIMKQGEKTIKVVR